MGHKHIAHIWSKPPKSFLGPTMLLVLKAFSGSPTFQLSTLFTIACCFYIWSDSHSCDLCLTPGASKTWINMKPTLLLGKRIQNMWTSLRVSATDFKEMWDNLVNCSQTGKLEQLLWRAMQRYDRSLVIWGTCFVRWIDGQGEQKCAHPAEEASSSRTASTSGEQ